MNTGFPDRKKRWEENDTTLQKCWLGFIGMMDILFNTLYTVRSRNWYLLSSCISVITLLAFAYNNINYVRCLTGMLSMSTLNDDFPEICQEFVARNFATQLDSVGKVSCCETDIVIEMLHIGDL